jgi:eukaryotic-like serine/threonine-protein kinase
MVARSTQPPAGLASARYELRRPLGEGSAGAVFQVLDRETGEEVALKKLFRLDQKSVQRFKREFRALADLHHPNLVKLYDLQRAEDGWFLTMEYVDGVDLKSDLLREPSHAGTSSTHIARVASAFHQLALGVQAVHRAGMLHRDLKPRNVVVAKSGRVVVLDFGLVREIGKDASAVTMDGGVAGTPAYMAPEQAAGLELTAASDWYAFGVMLYEMLSGVLPIEGKSPMALVRRKLTEDPAPLAAEFAPAELAALCLALLRRDPSQRPDAAQIISVLEPLFARVRPQKNSMEPDTALTETMGTPSRAPLFGRDSELAKLSEALDHASAGRSTVVHVRGTSGSGKSSLIEYFLDGLQESQSVFGPRSIVLRSRCYEREAMPFKALDGVIDALVSHLSKLAEVETAHLLPTEIHALTQVFPAFERLPVVRALTAAGRAARGDAAQIRRNAERGLRELFLNVAKSLTLVMWIDDLQWGDLDSASVLQDWLQRPADAPILILLSYRSEEVTTSSCLRQLVAADAASAAPLLRFEVSLSPLRDSDIQRLCEQRLGASHAPPAAITERIVAEAKGDPFLALQLTALAQAKVDRGEVDLAALSVEELVVRTSALLAEPAQALLSVLAVAGRPLLPQLALATAGVLREGRSHIHALQGLRLVRTRIVDGVRLLEFYHDRVREAISASLTAAESTQLHARLLHAVESSGQSDPAWLHSLALGAGQRALALRYGQTAAQIASSSLAFERSAELYARCVTLTDEREELAVLWSKLGLALARCRRGAEAADAYLKSRRVCERVGARRAPAAGSVTPVAQRSLRRRGAARAARDRGVAHRYPVDAGWLVRGDRLGACALRLVCAHGEAASHDRVAAGDDSAGRVLRHGRCVDGSVCAAQGGVVPSAYGEPRISVRRLVSDGPHHVFDRDDRVFVGYQCRSRPR